MERDPNILLGAPLLLIDETNLDLVGSLGMDTALES